MNNFIGLTDSKKERSFNNAALTLGIPPVLIEKDFWVCWMLQELFSLPGIAENLTFKGGTSLSKCYNAIHRFSEDVDITIASEFLRHAKIIDPAKGASPSQNERRRDAILKASQEAISQEIIPQLCERMAKVLGERGKWDIEINPQDKLKQSYLFHYPTIYPNNKSSVMLEFGTAFDVSLVQLSQVLPYVAEVFRDSLLFKPANVRALSPERTLWEKAMVLHRLHNKPEGKEIPARMARHYYDLYEMEKVGIFDKALKRSELLRQVVDSEELFFKRSGVDYDNIKYDTIRLVPLNSKIIEVLKNDYQSMQGMFFDSPPSFDQILSGLQDMEHRINILEKTLDPVKPVDLSIPSAVKAAQLDPQKVEQNVKLSLPHELMGYNKGDEFIGGRMNINEKEFAYMMNQYSQWAAVGGNDKSNRGKPEEFFQYLQNDLGVLGKMGDEDKFNRVMQKAMDAKDPMQGFYQITLVKCGARMDKDGAIEISQVVKDNVLALGRRSLRVKDMVLLDSPERQHELERMNLGNGRNLSR
jgi:hypothetical protein